MPFLFVPLMLLFCCVSILSAGGEEISILEKLPINDPDWVLQKKDSHKVRFNFGDSKVAFAEYSSASFINTKTDDMLAFTVEKYEEMNSPPIILGGPVQERAGTGFPGGITKALLDKETEPKHGGWSVTDVVRCHVIPWKPSADDGAKAQKSNMMEWSYVYEDDFKLGSPGKPRPNLMAHGYVLSYDKTVIYLQHTSSHVITSEFAQQIAIKLLRTRP